MSSCIQTSGSRLVLMYRSGGMKGLYQIKMRLDDQIKMVPVSLMILPMTADGCFSSRASTLGTCKKHALGAGQRFTSSELDLPRDSKWMQSIKATRTPVVTAHDNFRQATLKSFISS